MKKYLLRIWVVVLFFIASATNGFAEKNMRIATGEWDPYISKDLKYFGIVGRIVTEAFKLEGVNVEYGFFPWARAMDLTKSGEWDGSAVWVYNTERAKDFLFSDTVIAGKAVYFKLKSYPFDWETIDDLKGIHIGATIEYSYGKIFDSADKSGKIIVQRAPSDVINFKKLLAGRIKIFPNNLEVGYSLLNKNFSQKEIQLITHHPKYYQVSEYHFIILKNSERGKGFLKLFSKGLKRLKESGKYEQFLAESRRGEYIIKK